ncbi:hypothetical protein TYRP_017647 [Tyrophagus putrescentiae]|nr:hypothetical protein TYRP_017647 [Tyrophagus putrescentiae]
MTLFLLLLLSLTACSIASAAATTTTTTAFTPLPTSGLDIVSRCQQNCPQQLYHFSLCATYCPPVTTALCEAQLNLRPRFFLDSLVKIWSKILATNSCARADNKQKNKQADQRWSLVSEALLNRHNKARARKKKAYGNRAVSAVKGQDGLSMGQSTSLFFKKFFAPMALDRRHSNSSHNT